MGNYHDHCRLSGLLLDPGANVILLAPRVSYRPDRAVTVQSEHHGLFTWLTESQDLPGGRFADAVRQTHEQGPWNFERLTPATYDGYGRYTLPSGETWTVPDDAPYAVIRQDLWMAAVAHAATNAPRWTRHLETANAPGAPLAQQAYAALHYALLAAREVFTPLIPTPDDRADDHLSAALHLASWTVGAATRAQQARAVDDNWDEDGDDGETL